MSENIPVENNSQQQGRERERAPLTSLDTQSCELSALGRKRLRNKYLDEHDDEMEGELVSAPRLTVN